MRFPVYVQSCPPVDLDLYLSFVNVLILVDEMSGYNSSEQLGWRHWVLLGHDVDCVLHGVGGYNNCVVGFGIASFH